MSTEDCGNHNKKWKIASVIGIIIVVAIVFGIAWAFLHPKKPSFIIRDATIHNLSVNSSPGLFTSVFQITIDSRNPNARIGFYYKNLNAYATYRDQQISLYTTIQPTYQGHKDSNIWSPLLIGTNVPISPYNAYALSQDQASGTIPIVIKIMGQYRWKLSGGFKSRPTHLHVTCPAYIPYGSEIQGTVIAGTSIKYPLSVNCQVDW